MKLLWANSFREAGEAAAVFSAAPETDEQTLAVCGLALLKTGRFSDAEALFEKISLRSPENPEVHLGLGQIDRIRNNNDAAIVHFRRAIASSGFYEEAFRRLWRAAWDRGEISGLSEIHNLAEERFRKESKPLPSWITNAFTQIQGLSGKRLYQREDRIERLRVPLVTHADSRIRMLTFKLNGKKEYPFDLDSASADFMTVSPLLAEELGLSQTGSATASGVGSGSAAVRFSMLDKVALEGIVFRNVPVMVSDIHSFRGLRKGLIGTALLKRFNVTIDIEAGVMDFFPLDRPELLAANIDPAAVAADIPLYIFDQTVVAASIGGAPDALYILDTAAATNLIDRPFFGEHLEPKLDPARLIRGGIQGAQGAQETVRVDGLPISLGPLVFPRQTVHVFAMDTLNMISGRYAAGLLGHPLLWPYRVHMNFRTSRLILEKKDKNRPEN